MTEDEDKKVKQYKAVIKRAKTICAEIADIPDEDVRLNLLCFALLIERCNQLVSGALKLIDDEKGDMAEMMRKRVKTEYGIIEGFDVAAKSCVKLLPKVALAVTLYELLGEDA